MKQRVNLPKTVPEAYQVMRGFEEYARTSEIDHKLAELIKIRTSQINRCAFCLDMHTHA